MQASNAFRSHLMQQFASAARNQSRPPLAMMPWIAEESKNKKKKRGPTAHTLTTSAAPQRRLANHSAWASSSSSTSTRPSNSVVSSRCHPSTSRNGRGISPPAHLASISLSSVAEDDSHLDEEHPNEHQEQHLTLTARNFQALIQTRRSTNHFDTLSAPTETFWKDALDRAVACALRAPNLQHKRTQQAFRFKRMIGPSTATRRLAEIAYQVSLFKSQSEITAERKRFKWAKIPAFLVAMVRAPEPLYPQEEDLTSSTSALYYHPMDFVPLQSERETEDYASTCAAVQNVLLSLHAEQIASKWATGPVIQTPAFRELVGATALDRIVALVMVGLPKSSVVTEEDDAEPRQQRHVRRESEEVMQDL